MNTLKIQIMMKMQNKNVNPNINEITQINMDIKSAIT